VRALRIRVSYDDSGFVITDAKDIGRVLAALGRAIPVECESPRHPTRWGAQALVIAKAAPSYFGLELIDWPTAAQMGDPPAGPDLTAGPEATPATPAPAKGDDDVPF